MCTSFEIRHFGPFSPVNGRKTPYVTSPEFLALLTVFSYAKLRKLRFRLIFKNRQPRIRTCDTRPADQASKNPIDVVLEWQNKKAGNMTSRQCTKPRNFDLQKLMLQPTRDLWRYEIRRVTRTVYNAYREGRRHHAMQESFLVLFCCQLGRNCYNSIQQLIADLGTLNVTAADVRTTEQHLRLSKPDVLSSSNPSTRQVQAASGKQTSSRSSTKHISTHLHKSLDLRCGIFISVSLKSLLR